MCVCLCVCSYITPCHAIVKDSNDDEEDIKAGENNEEKVERVPHLLGGQNEDDEDVPEDSQAPHTHLKTTNFKPSCIGQNDLLEAR